MGLRVVEVLGLNDGDIPGPNVGVAGDAPPPSSANVGTVRERRRFSSESVVPF